MFTSCQVTLYITIWLMSRDQGVSLYAPGGGADLNVHCVTEWLVTKAFTAKWLVTMWRVTKVLNAKWQMTKWLVKCPYAKWRVFGQVVKEVYCTYISCFIFHTRQVSDISDILHFLLFSYCKTSAKRVLSR